ncbi:MAG: amino acid ABC transporter permease [Clostridia bacterium]|nr:amino acid ABC transporter permease [Clostridia bacterium]
MFWKVFGDLCLGFLTTLEIFALTLVIAIPLGLLVAFGTMSKFKPLKWLLVGFVWIIRGTPLMLQLFIVCYGPGLIGLPPVKDPMVATIIAFGINYACYFSVIYKGGIESITQGQREAGLVLGMTKTQIFFKIILFQVIRRILAPMSNETITLVKDTSLANTIMVPELIKQANVIAKSFAMNYLTMLLYTAVFYLIFNGLLTILFNKIEKKMSFYKV